MIPSTECIICFEDYNYMIIFDCSHTICLVCYEKILNTNNALCPICRSDIDNIIDNNINNNIIEESIPDTNSYYVKLIFYLILIIIIISLFTN